MKAKRGKKRGVLASTIRSYPILESRCHVKTPDEIRQLLEDAFSAGELSADAKRKMKEDAQALEAAKLQAAQSEHTWTAAHAEFAIATEAVKAALSGLVDADQVDEVEPPEGEPGPLAKAAATLGQRPKAPASASSAAPATGGERRR